MTEPSPLEAIFFAALEHGTAQERAAYLDEACAGDADLRRRVEKMLEAQAQAGSFLEEPAVSPVGTTEERPIEEGPGTVIGPYKLFEKIGEGGFGVVFLAEQTQPVRRKVALKVLKPGMDTRQVVARFEAERQALAIMDHPNIAKVFDGGATPSGRPYFVMELVKGVPIKEYCDQNNLTPRQRLELFIPVCHAVQHAHQKGIIHRDLKPGNILVSRHDTAAVVKVIDFGVAKALGQELTEKTLFTGFAQMIGTPLYMSPEQAGMSDLDIDTRSDIYSLGVLLYELLTGTTPFDKERFQRIAYDEVRRIIREEEPPKPSTRLSHSKDALPSISAHRQTEPAKLTKLVRGELDWIVMKALEKDRTRRYETAKDFAADVQRYLSDEQVQACPPSAAYRFRKFVRRNRGPVLAAVSIFLLLVGGIVGTSVGLVRAEWAREDAVTAQEAETVHRRTADEERAVAEAVNDFLQKDLLGQVELENQPGGGDGARDPDIKVRTVLDRVAKSIESRFGNQPRVEAAIRLTIAKAYQAIGQSKKAQLHTERSVALRTAHLGADHADTLTSKDTLADTYYVQGFHERAVALFQEVLEKRTITLDPDHRDTLSSKLNMAFIYGQQGKDDQAEPLLHEVVQKREALLGAHDPATLSSKNNLAWLHFKRGNFALAETLYIELIRAFESTLGADHPGTLLAKSNLGLVYGTQRKDDLAEPLYREVLQKRIELQGPNHAATLTSKIILGSSYREQRKFDLAVPMLEEALEGCKASQGKDHPNTLNAMRHLGSTYLACGKPELARPLFEQMLVTYKETPPENETDTHAAKNGLANAYFALKMPAKALPLVREFVDGYRKRMGADSLEFAGFLAWSCQDLLRYEQYPEAEKYLQESLAIREKMEPDSWRTFNARSVLGGALVSQKKYADAEPLLRTGYEGMKQREDKIPMNAKGTITAALRRLVQLYEGWAKPDDAAKWRKELESRRPPVKPKEK